MTSHTFIELNDLIDTLRREGVDLGANPKGTIAYWRKRKLIDRPNLTSAGARKGTRSVYPISVLSTIRRIRELEKKGLNLDQIREELKKEEIPPDDDLASLRKRIAENYPVKRLERFRDLLEMMREVDIDTLRKLVQEAIDKSEGGDE